MKRLLSSHWIKDHQLRFLIVCAIVVVALYDLCPAFISLDTPYFILAGEHWAHGEFDCLRAPLYPLLVYACAIPFGESGRMPLVMIVQNLFFLLSIAAFFKIAKRIIPNAKVYIPLTLFYILTPMAGWCKAIHIDSLNTSFCLLLCYFLFKLIDSPTWQKGLAAAIITAFLVLFRSTFVILFAVLPLLYLFLFITNRRKVIFLLMAFLLIPMGGYHLYCKAFERHFGIYDSSISPVCCNYINLWQSGLYPTLHQHLSTQEKTQAIDKLDSLSLLPPYVAEANYDKLYWIVSHDHNAKVYKEASNEMIDKAGRSYTQARLKRIASEIQRPFYPGIGDGNALSSILYAATNLLFIPLSFMLLVMLLSLAYLCWQLFHRRRIPLHYMLLSLMLSTYCGGILLTGSDSFSRLLLPVYPIMLLLAGHGVAHGARWIYKSN